MTITHAQNTLPVCMFDLLPTASVWIVCSTTVLDLSDGVQGLDVLGLRWWVFSTTVGVLFVVAETMAGVLSQSLATGYIDNDETIEACI